MVMCLQWVLVLVVLSSASAEDVITLSEAKLVNIALPSNKPFRLVSSLFTKQSADFYIPQCHSKQTNLTMYQPKQLFGVEETGPSIGDVLYGGTNSTLHVTNKNDLTMNIYCTYTKYTKSDPVPGGCNMEFNFEDDPNIHTWYDGFQLWIQFQYANTKDALCDNTTSFSQLKYSIYALHFDSGGSGSEKNYVDSLTKSIKGVDEHAPKLLEHTRAISSKPAMIITSYPDQPVFIGIVVTDTSTGRQASYVSTVSYGCDINRYTSDHPCQVQWYFYLLASILGLIGVFLTFVGHRYFYCEVFIHGFLVALLCSFIGLMIAQVSSAALLAGSGGLALVGGGLWLALWCTAGIATLNAVLAATNAGFLISSIIFYTPLANVSIFSNNWEMWLMYPIPIVLMILVFVIFPKKVNIVSCAFLGSYCFTAAISVFIQASLHHIVVETIRRATVYQYFNAVFSAPFTAKDGGLMALWIVLAVAGSVTQFYTEREKQDFPMSPRKKRLGARLSAELEEQARLLSPPNSTLRPPTPRKDYGAVDP